MAKVPMWKVKTDDGSEYGPVDEGKLREWARAGRITPGSRVSPDGTNWILAPQKPELEMDWLVEVSPDEYFGPFHHDVVQGLLNAKKISPRTRTFRLSGKAEAESKADNARLKTALEEEKSKSSATAAKLSAVESKLSATEDELARTRSSLEAVQAELESAKARGKRLNGVLAESGSREAMLAKEVVALKASLQTESSRAKKLDEELDLAKGDLRSTREDLDVTRDELRSTRDELKSTKAELVRERKTCEDLKVAAEKAARKKADATVGGLFQNKSLHDLSLLELAAQRELARAKRGRGKPGPGPARLDVIDV